MPTPKGDSGHKNAYRRSETKEAKRLKWLMLSELSYEKTPIDKSSAQDANQESTSRKYEMVQRTTHHAQASGDGEGSGSVGINSVDIMCIVHKAKKNFGATRNGKAKPKRFLVIVTQYRPPVDAFVLEMPAGLLDESDTNPTFSAARELYEETGYVVSEEFLLWQDAEEERKKEEDKEKESKPPSNSKFDEGLATSYGPLSYDPGLTDSTFDLVRFDIHVNDDAEGDDETNEDKKSDKKSDITRRMNKINQNPEAHLDEGEDAVTHLLQLDSDSDADEEDPKGGDRGILSRLENLRRSVHNNAIVDGKLQTLIIGMAFGKK